MVEAALELFKQALNIFYKNDSQFAKRGGMEQACVFRIGIYLDKLISSEIQFEDLSLDCEYNKNGEEAKVTLRRPNGTKPDLIIHKRGDNSYNLLVVEFKAKNNSNKRNDIIKLEDFTNQDGKYKYKLGIFIRLMDTYEKTLEKMEYFKNGQKLY